MPRRPGVDLTRSGSRKKNKNTSANSRAGKRSRLSDTILIKDYTKGPSYVSELHKKQMVSAMNAGRRIVGKGLPGC